MNISDNALIGEVAFSKGNDIICNDYIYGNVWIFHVELPEKGMTKGKHKHEFDHIHYTVKGTARLIIYADLESDKILAETTITENKFFKVPKEHIHEIIALEGGYIGMCIHAVRDEDEKAIETNYIEDIKGA